MTELAAVLPGAEARWKPLSQLRGRRVPQNVLHWLADDGSLTRRLQAACGPAFRVRVLHQGWSRPHPSEARLLHMRRGETAMLREVELCCGAGVWVFARTLIPARSLRGPLRRLASLGARPLGAVLFSDPALRRGPTQVTHLLPGHALFQAAAVSLAVRPADLWGRRSLFYLAGKPLLVNEIFLPAPVAARGEGADG